MSSASDDRLLGEYRLKELLSENSEIHRWLAEQVSVSRRVLVDELKPGREHLRAAFLADVRAKAAVEHPLIGSVFEAVADPGCCFFAHELLPGVTLEARRTAGEPLKPARLAHILRRVAEAQIHHEALGQATSPLGLEHIHIDEHDVIRLDNLATGDPRDPAQSARDVMALGAALRSLIADGKPGATRMLTLTGWMRGEGVPAPLSWEQVRDFAVQIEQQLAEPPPPATGTKPVANPAKKPPVALIALVVGLLLIAAVTVVLRMRPDTPPPPPRAALPEALSIPAGRYPTPDGAEEPTQAFLISPHEVTIGQYAEFVERLQTLVKDKLERTFDHEDQPPEKSSHLPDDWENLLAAAKTGGTWNGREVSLDHPVVGVDWWDAAAYAEWKHARLATQEEWFAALSKEFPDPSTLKPSAWTAVTAATTDRTPSGMLGMAGSVCEWTRRPAANPANPLGERKWVIIGGSFLKPGTNALTREWTDERSLRRPDLGFRVVFEPR